MTDEVKHIWELLLLMGKLTDDDRFKVEYYKEHIKEPMNMCEWMDKVEEKSKHQQAVNSAIRMIKAGKLTNEEISDYLELPLAEVIALSKEINAATV